ncbi:hypothetical protein BJAS_P4340 [Bathymodiolus japonicus methanotrophic gill symbiont]|uniref:hypothetical protein n=1 Tax=Bathymodiolus japonicus methanotrophic gill symbiont TaxID=113269 RepID=UPI001B446AFE|nr:hypothetical protein [Bathymodiolus japonicus methanotrophic gill symbiont]GFO72830.1 hypothetical protein BJAS_P3347 [Bathymodiolus japonicus methanotrophic gill symbiont]GFO73089.1 hypothetical protein BJAS_P3678 [Bathymodiolus japonicus methanotrophic gill symbiont]GFO73506.1 hypothetical protein BJAS_P4340 [Bathymodiolus japonicus methanotrophic gill symbiont]
MSTCKKYGLTVFFLVGLFSILAYARYTLTGDEGNSEEGGVIEKVSKVEKVSPTFVPEKIRHNPSQKPPEVSEKVHSGYKAWEPPSDMEYAYTEYPDTENSDTEHSDENKKNIESEFEAMEEFFGGQEEDVSFAPMEDFPIPDYVKKETELSIRQMKERGYVDMTENSITPIRDEMTPKSKKFEKTHEEAVKLLTVEPTNLDETPFEGKKVVSRQVSGLYDEGKWTTLTRVYEFDNLSLVQLSEDDYHTGGGKVVFTEEAVNENINGNPAIYEVGISPSGKATTSLVWTTDSKYYELTLEKNASSSKEMKEEFLNLARSVPID